MEFFCPARALAVPATLLDDAYTSAEKPTGKYGSQATIVVSSKTTGYIQFDLSTLPAGTQAADVAKASLTLFVSAGSVKTPGSFSVQAVAGAWDELTLNQANAPAIGATVAGNIPVAATDGNQFIAIDVTSAVQQWLAGTISNYGFALVANGATMLSFDAKESGTTGHNAQLEITLVGGSTSGAGPTG